MTGQLRASLWMDTSESDLVQLASLYWPLAPDTPALDERSRQAKLAAGKNLMWPVSECPTAKWKSVYGLRSIRRRFGYDFHVSGALIAGTTMDKG